MISRDKDTGLKKFARRLWPVQAGNGESTRLEELTGRQRPGWVQGLTSYLTLVVLICGLPLSPALLALLIAWLCR